MHSKLQWLTSAVLCAAGLLTAMPVVLAAQQDSKPNILFILSDDQSFDTIRALGNSEINTPNLDRLVERGTTFTHAYNMGSWTGAVCVPSRTMLFTGRFLWPVQTLNKNLEVERAAGRVWPQLMRSAGYRTYMTGKWHVNVDATKAFDIARHIRPGMPKQTEVGYDRPHEGKPDPWSPYDPQFGGFWEGGKHWSEVVRDDAIDFIELAAEDERPFFMYIAFNAPHDPRQSPKEYIDRYPLEKISVPPNFIREYPFKDSIGCGTNQRDEKLAPFPRTEHAVKVHRQEYYALISHMDAQVGRILDAVEKSKKAANTYIIFTSDHGLAVGQHGFMGKQNLYDHSVRVPCIVVGPNIAKGKRIDTPIYMQDIVPTTVELAGLKRQPHIQFNSLMPLLRGETKRSAYDAIYGAYLGLQRSVTSDGYKLIVYPAIKELRLYNVARDPREIADLAEEPGSHAIVERLFAKLIELQQQTGDSLDLAGIFASLQ